MLKVLEVFPIGTMLSVTLEGDCKKLSNGSRLVDRDGNIIVVDSVAMTRHSNPEDIISNTVVLVSKCNIKTGSELSIA